jgi:hypothetical protein
MAIFNSYVKLPEGREKQQLPPLLNLFISPSSWTSRRPGQATCRPRRCSAGRSQTLRATSTVVVSSSPSWDTRADGWWYLVVPSWAWLRAKMTMNGSERVRKSEDQISACRFVASTGSGSYTKKSSQFHQTPGSTFNFSSSSPIFLLWRVPLV